MERTSKRMRVNSDVSALSGGEDYGMGPLGSIGGCNPIQEKHSSLVIHLRPPLAIFHVLCKPLLQPWYSLFRDVGDSQA